MDRSPKKRTANAKKPSAKPKAKKPRSRAAKGDLSAEALKVMNDQIVHGDDPWTMWNGAPNRDAFLGKINAVQGDLKPVTFSDISDKMSKMIRRHNGPSKHPYPFVHYQHLFDEIKEHHRQNGNLYDLRPECQKFLATNIAELRRGKMGKERATLLEDIGINKTNCQSCAIIASQSDGCFVQLRKLISILEETGGDLRNLTRNPYTMDTYGKDDCQNLTKYAANIRKHADENKLHDLVRKMLNEASQKKNGRDFEFGLIRSDYSHSCVREFKPVQHLLAPASVSGRSGTGQAWDETQLNAMMCIVNQTRVSGVLPPDEKSVQPYYDHVANKYGQHGRNGEAIRDAIHDLRRNNGFKTRLSTKNLQEQLDLLIQKLSENTNCWNFGEVNNGDTGGESPDALAKHSIDNKGTQSRKRKQPPLPMARKKRAATLQGETTGPVGTRGLKSPPLHLATNTSNGGPAAGQRASVTPSPYVVAMVGQESSFAPVARAIRGTYTPTSFEQPTLRAPGQLSQDNVTNLMSGDNIMGATTTEFRQDNAASFDSEFWEASTAAAAFAATGLPPVSLAAAHLLAGPPQDHVPDFASGGNPMNVSTFDTSGQDGHFSPSDNSLPDGTIAASASVIQVGDDQDFVSADNTDGDSKPAVKADDDMVAV